MNIYELNASAGNRELKQPTIKASNEQPARHSQLLLNSCNSKHLSSQKVPMTMAKGVGGGCKCTCNLIEISQHLCVCVLCMCIGFQYNRIKQSVVRRYVEKCCQQKNLSLFTFFWPQNFLCFHPAPNKLLIKFNETCASECFFKVFPYHLNEDAFQFRFFSRTADNHPRFSAHR